jgi:hypothetical protein
MKTENLIRALAADAARPVVGIRTQLGVALAVGTAASMVLFRLLLKPRPDLADAIHGRPFLLKATIVLLLAVTTGGLLASVARPLPAPTLRRLAFAPLLLATAVIVELVSVPAGGWLSRVDGPNVLHCLGSIPLLSLPPALCLFFAMRRGAPASTALAGAIAGLAAAAVGASLYALACPEDSPLFIALWYSLAIGAVTALGSFAGRRWLRW